MTLPRPILGTDPLRPPPESAGATDGTDPILEHYGPRPDEPTGEAAGVPVGPEEVTAMLVGLFDGLAAVRGPHWHAEPDEFAMAAPPLARELSKPDTTIAAWLAQHGDAFLIILGLGAVTVPRAWTEWRVMRLRRELAREQQGEHVAPEPLYPAGWPRAAEAPTEDGAGPGLSEPGGGEAAAAIPSDPLSVAAAVGSILG